MIALDDRMARGHAWYVTLLFDLRWQHRDARVPLEDLDDTHRRNLLAWIDRHATGIVGLAYWGAAKWWGHQASLPHGDQTELAMEHAMDAEIDAMLDDPIAWLHDTPFYVRLAELVAADRTQIALPLRATHAPRPRPIPVEA